MAMVSANVHDKVRLLLGHVPAIRAFMLRRNTALVPDMTVETLPPLITVPTQLATIRFQQEHFAYFRMREIFRCG